MVLERFFILSNGGTYLKFIFLTKDFYIAYSKCTEIEQKPNRPYAMLLTQIDGITWAIPLRSNISHNNVVWSDQAKKCGLDLSKAVVIEDSKYIDTTTAVWIRNSEFSVLKTKANLVNRRMKSYIKKYAKAYKRQDVERNRILCEYSTLQYFHKYIDGIDE